jgi:hypothetical protein
MMIPQRPSISDLYKDVRHEWSEPDLTKSGKIVADTSDEESNLPGDPLDLDEEMMLPQKQMVKEIYQHLPSQQHHHQEQYQYTHGGEKKEVCDDENQKSQSSGSGTAVEIDPPPGSHEMPAVSAPQHGAREDNMIDAEKDVTVGITLAIVEADLFYFISILKRRCYLLFNFILQKMESKQGHGDPHPRSASELPGLVTQDTTLMNKSGPVHFHESGIAENDVREK